MHFVLLCIDACRRILMQALGPKADYQIGSHKVFLKDSQDALLDVEREAAIKK